MPTENLIEEMGNMICINVQKLIKKPQKSVNLHIQVVWEQKIIHT